MTQDKHTPGPWAAHDKAAYGTSITNGSITGQYIADVQMYRGLTLDEYKANVRLIAAAPDLLASLRVFVERAWSSCRFSDAEVAAARAAIAKATGA
ncbi:MAG: hypothetical protein KGS47_16970 [Chloroflexi bacterium]|nr:hypothetical protein [Chloroflexota bacterium]